MPISLYLLALPGARSLGSYPGAFQLDAQFPCVEVLLAISGNAPVCEDADVHVERAVHSNIGLFMLLPDTAHSATPRAAVQIPSTGMSQAPSGRSRMRSEDQWRSKTPRWNPYQTSTAPLLQLGACIYPTGVTP